MKLVKPMLVASALTFSVASAFAVSADLRIVGIIKTPACSLDLGSGGVIDFGSIERGNLSQSASTAIGSRAMDIKVNCDANTLIGIKVADTMPNAKPASAMNFKFDYVNPGSLDLGNDRIFGLGGGSTPIGGYALRVGNTTVDTRVADRMAISSDSKSWIEHSTTHVHLSQNHSYFAPMNNNNQLVVGKNFTFPVDVALSIDQANKVPSDQDINLEGKSTIEVVYL